MISSRTYIFITVSLSLVLAACTIAWDFANFMRECSAAGYSKDGYLAYCDSDRYGDYEHGAFYFELEPVAVSALRKASIVFLGNSRMQFALSTDATAKAFAGQGKSLRYYLLGFGYGENYDFALVLLRRLHIVPRVIVVNADERFFLREQSPPAQFVTTSRGARINYEMKLHRQTIHQMLCQSPSEQSGSWCGTLGSIFRSRETGAWHTEKHFRQSHGINIAMPSGVDNASVEMFSAGVGDFLSRIGIRPECVIFITSPLQNVSEDTIGALAKKFGVTHVGLGPSGAAPARTWRTLDGSHLSPEAAEEWSARILLAAKPSLSRCGVDSP